jgi:hypothetical protein
MRVEGHSYNEIYKALRIPKSTLCSWFKNTVLSDEARERLATRVHEGSINGLLTLNKSQTKEAKRRADATNTKAKNEIELMSKKELLLVGTALYWAEGYKRLRIKDGKERTSHPIRFVNTDPDMIRIFMRFLLEVCEIDSRNIILTMRLYPHINEDAARTYWMAVTGLPLEQFRRSTFLISGASKGIRPFVRLPYGTLQIDVNSTAKFHQIMGWIEGVKKQT